MHTIFRGRRYIGVKQAKKGGGVGGQEEQEMSILTTLLYSFHDFSWHNSKAYGSYVHHMTDVLNLYTL